MVRIPGKRIGFPHYAHLYLEELVRKTTGFYRNGTVEPSENAVRQTDMKARCA